MEYEPLSLLTMLIGLAGGLALFLHGMTMMSNALRAMAGSRMKEIMATLAGNRFSALLTGAIATAVVQSSSVTTVIAIGFVSAGILTLGQAIAVSMGGAVGSTLTAQIIAFNIGYFALLLIALGFGLSMWKSHRVASHIGTMILGLGVLFVGLSMMSEFMAPLRTHQPFIDLMASMRNPLLGILLGAAFTAVVQSSSATLGVIIALASQGLIPLEAGIALVFGANLGTTVTALLATIGQPRAALHTAIGHVSFKVILVLIWLPLIGPLEQITRAVSPSADGLMLAEQLAYEVPRQVANVHTIINVTTVLLLLPFVHLLAALIVRVVGEGPRAKELEQVAPALNPVLYEMPPLAIDAVRQELRLLGERVREQLDLAMAAILSGKPIDIGPVQARERLIDKHHAEIVHYVEHLLQQELARDTGLATVDLVEVADYLESLGDLVERELIPLYERHRASGSSLSPDSKERLRAFATAVSGELHRALNVVADADEALAPTWTTRTQPVTRRRITPIDADRQRMKTSGTGLRYDSFLARFPGFPGFRGFPGFPGFPGTVHIYRLLGFPALLSHLGGPQPQRHLGIGWILFSTAKEIGQGFALKQAQLTRLWREGYWIRSRNSGGWSERCSIWIPLRVIPMHGLASLAVLWNANSRNHCAVPTAWCVVSYVWAQACCAPTWTTRTQPVTRRRITPIDADRQRMKTSGTGLRYDSFLARFPGTVRFRFRFRGQYTYIAFCQRLPLCVT
jgi:phosphate:Na+ symporter